MKKILFAAAALLLSLTSCSKDETLEGGSGYPEPTSGTRVSLTLKGSAEIGQSTRDNGADGTVSGKLAAKAEEKKVNSLLAVAFFHNDYSTAQGGAEGTLYKVIDVTLPADKDTSLPWFDMAFDGRFDVWFVANADDALTQKIKALVEKTDKVDAFQKLVSEQTPDTDNKFLMISTEGYDITTLTGSTTPVAVVMRRASVRVDIINRIPGVTVKQVKFINRAMHSRIATPNMQTEAPSNYTSDKIYKAELGENGLVGYLPTGQGDESAKITASKCEGKIYSYENLNDDTANKISTLELTYEIDGASTPEGAPISKTYTVEFKVKAGDPAQLTQLQLKRNHLYRVVLNEKHSDEIVSAQIIVEDWNTAEEFKVEEMPFDPSANKNLMVNRFAHYNAKNVDLKNYTFEFNTLFDNHSDLNGSILTHEEIIGLKEYFNWNEMLEAGLIGYSATAIFTDGNGKKWRMPTQGELELLSPMGDKIRFDAQALAETQGKETLYFKNGANGQLDTSSQSLSGDYELQKATKAESLLDGTQVYTVYGIRFKGTDQESAYRWKVCDTDQSTQGASEHYISIQIKSLYNTATKTSLNKMISEVANEDFWLDGFIEIQIPLNGFIWFDTSVKESNRGFLRSCTIMEEKKNSYLATLYAKDVHIATQKEWGIFDYCPLRFVEATAEDEAAWEKAKAEREKELQTAQQNPYYGAEVGDFIMSDGTLVKAAEMETQTTERKAQAVAIVFSVETHRVDSDAQRAVGLRHQVHGRALALKNAGANMAWASAEKADIHVDKIRTASNLKESYNDFDGYKNTKAIYAASSNLATDYPVANAVKTFSVQAPSNTSGWYLPAAGERFDILENLACTGNPTLKKWLEELSMNTDNVTGAISNQCTAAATSINDYMKKVGEENYDSIHKAPSTWYWTSTEVSRGNAVYDVIFEEDGNRLTFQAVNKLYPYLSSSRVRPVLAF